MTERGSTREHQLVKLGKEAVTENRLWLSPTLLNGIRLRRIRRYRHEDEVITDLAARGGRRLKVQWLSNTMEELSISYIYKISDNFRVVGGNVLLESGAESDHRP